MHAITDPLSLHVGQVKDKWRREFRETLDQIKNLEKKLDDIKRKLEAADEILDEAKTTQVSQGASLNGIGKYAGMGVTDAIKAFYGEHKYQGYSISTLTDRLQSEGLKSDAQNLKQTVYMTCRRLEDDHFLRSEWKGTFKVFKLEDSKNGTLTPKN